MGRYIEILGVMGSGKTSLLKVFNEAGGYTPIVEAEGDLKRLFFLDPPNQNIGKYVFENGLNFIAFNLNKLKEGLYDLGIKTAAKPDIDIVTDMSLLMQYAYAKPTASECDMDVLSSVIGHSMLKLPQPDLRVVITLPSDVHLSRIRERGRENEQGIPESFLASVQSSMMEAIKEFGYDAPVLYLDGSKLDWVNNEEDKKTVLAKVETRLAAPRR